MLDTATEHVPMPEQIWMILSLVSWKRLIWVGIKVNKLQPELYRRFDIARLFKLYSHHYRYFLSFLIFSENDDIQKVLSTGRLLAVLKCI